MRNLACVVLVMSVCNFFSISGSLWAADQLESPGSKITREKKLKAKISVDCDNMMLREIIAELQGGLKDAKAGTIRIKPDPKAGITLTTRMSIKAKNEPFEKVLDRLLENSGRPWGYYVFVSPKKDDQDDGAIIITNDATCRGFPPGDPRNQKAKEEPKKKK